MRIKIYLFLLSVFMFFHSQSLTGQTFTMPTGVNVSLTANSCTGTFVDNGGSGSNYTNNQRSRYVICPDTPGEKAEVTFNSFNIESAFDSLVIFDGNPSEYSWPLFGNPQLIGVFWGTNSPGTVTSTASSGCLSFYFSSDFSVNRPGWSATVTCAANVLTMPTGINAGLTANTCSATFVDNGGSGSNYTNNQRSRYIICPDVPGAKVEATFTSFNIESAFDSLVIFDGNEFEYSWPLFGNPQLIGVFWGMNSPGTVTSTAASGCLSFYFSSDFSVTRAGWSAIISCIVGCAPPTAACQDATVQLDGLGAGSLDPDDVDDGSTADCGLASETVNPNAFDCDDIGPNTVTYMITDINGASSSCTAIVTVEDNIAPVPTCVNATVQLDGNGDGNLAPSAIHGGSMEACGFLPLSASPTAFTCDDVGSNTATLTVRDVNGNSATCTATVTIEDNVPPVAKCKDATVTLDGSGNGTLLGTAVDNMSTDACGVASVSVSPAFFGCSDLGGNTVTLEVTDNNGNSATCTATATIEDNIRPSISCPPDAVFPNDPGACEGTFTVPLANASDNCAVTVFRYRWREVDAMGNNITPSWSSWSTDAMQTLDVGFWKIQWQAKDASNNQRKCSFFVDIIDEERPGISCPADAVFPNDPGACEGTFTVPLANASDNCGVTVLRYRWREVDAMGNNITPSWSSWSTDAMQTLDVGFWKIQWQAKDASNNQRKCSFLVEIKDTELPIPACLDAGVTFNGEPTLPVTVSELYDALASTDNCGTVNLVSPTTDELVDCDQLGEVIDVTVVVNDGNGNEGMCTATITVDGLPCGWIDNGGIACGGSSSSFDTGVSEFSLTAGSCAPAYPFTSDATSFIFTELCGDGEIIAKVEGISGGQGFAGVMARDSEAPGSPKVSIGTNTINRVRKEVRAIANYPSFPQAVLAYDQFWVRIMRTGPSFKAFASPDGVQWFQYIFQNIQMGDCIKVGLFAYNEKATSPITATFSNVSVNGVTVGALDGGSSTTTFLGADHGGFENHHDLSSAIGLYPNPVNDIVNLNLPSLLGEAATISIFNVNGQLMEQVQYDEIEEVTTQFNVAALPAGTYFVNVKTEKTYESLRFVKQ